MDKSQASLVRKKVLGIRAKLRSLYFRILGLKMGRHVSLGKLICDWPNKVSIGADSIIEDYVIFKVSKPFNDTNRISIGKTVFIGSGCQFNSHSHITVGDDCMIASNTIIVDTSHEIFPGKNMNKQAVLSSPIIIENNVWIGAGCKILKGVTIGTGSVIGAGSVVNRSVPCNQIWAGIPARFIKFRA